MFNFGLSMNKIFCLVVVFATGCNSLEQKALNTFAVEIIQIFREQNITKFKGLAVYPDYSISDDAVAYIFGTADKEGWVDLFKNRHISTKFYGPYDRDGHIGYSVVFYDDQRIQPNQNGYFDIAEIKRGWGTAYLETLVIIIDEEVMFYRTPFYHGSHAPWEGDYG